MVRVYRSDILPAETEKVLIIIKLVESIIHIYNTPGYQEKECHKCQKNYPLDSAFINCWKNLNFKI